MTIHRFLPVVASFFALSALTACSEPGISATTTGEREEFSVKVVMAPTRLANQSTRFETIGTGRGQQSIALYADSSGEVVERRFSAGDKVAAGDILLRLEERDEALAVELAKVSLRDAERLLRRYQRAEGNAAILPTTIDAAETAVETARLELDVARVALERRRVIAPFAGYVGISDIELGDRIGPDTVVTTLDNRDTLLVRLDVPEALNGQLNRGDTLQVETWDFTQQTRTATVVDIDSRINPETRTFRIQARVDNSDDVLRPGMSFRVTLDIIGGEYPVVPEVAVQWGANGAYIWRVVNDRARQVGVGIVERRAGEILLDAPLTAADRIVVEGVQSVREGVLLTNVQAVSAISSSDF